jgi:hypothetical protein
MYLCCFIRFVVPDTGLNLEAVLVYDMKALVY